MQPVFISYSCFFITDTHCESAHRLRELWSHQPTSVLKLTLKCSNTQEGGWGGVSENGCRSPLEVSRAVKFSSDLTQGWLIAGISRGRLKEPSQGQQERRRGAAIPDCQHTSYSRSNDGVLMIPAKTPIEPLQTVCLSPVNNLNFPFRYQFSEILSRGHWLIGQQERVQGCFLVLASYTGSGQGATTVANS